jgi:hypothetical protein
MQYTCDWVVLDIRFVSHIHFRFYDRPRRVSIAVSSGVDGGGIEPDEPSIHLGLEIAFLSSGEEYQTYGPASPYLTVTEVHVGGQDRRQPSSFLFWVVQTRSRFGPVWSYPLPYQPLSTLSFTDCPRWPALSVPPVRRRASGERQYQLHPYPLVDQRSVRLNRTSEDPLVVSMSPAPTKSVDSGSIHGKPDLTIRLYHCPSASEK